ncbi:MAG: nitroreductase family protein, partial [Desulfobacteraceae bacterium]|nr:nitroreductase family protein [Desulfobacteraceae bacterium]
MNPILDLLSAHRSIRKFLDTPVDADLLRSLVVAAQCTSTSHHVQAYTIIQVQDKNVKRKIA